jgi:hypothetical protein
MTTEKTYQFRASYSVLNLWYQGRFEDAIRAYFKLPMTETWQMREGKRLHDEWEAESKQTKCLPAVFGGRPLKNPVFDSDGKLTAEIYPWLLLVGRPDLLDSPDIHEYKSGVMPASHYIKTYQLGMYAILAIKAGHNVTRGWVHHYNQYSGEKESEGVWLTNAYLSESVNWLETMAGEMRAYILKNDLLTRFGVIKV